MDSEENPIQSDDSDQSNFAFPITPENLQETPDYITKKCKRVQIAPIELFADNESQLKENNLQSTESCKETGSMEMIPVFQNGSLCINAGGVDSSTDIDGVIFQKDEYFFDGDCVTTDVKIGGNEGHVLYQSARVGDFVYKFMNLKQGEYLVDLHLAEIVFYNGPKGMRVFDVFIQEEKVVSSIDIYSQVGANHPLILSDLQAVVIGDEGLCIRFEGIAGKPIVSGISIRSCSSTGDKFFLMDSGNTTSVTGNGHGIINVDNCNNCKKLKQQHDLLYTEQLEVKKLLENVKQENELKSKECHEAWTSLRELRNELMRKSMHVGSLACAVEGQVREKSIWFQALDDLSQKLKLLKIDHANLSEETLEYKKCLADMSQMASTLQFTVDQHFDIERELNDLKFEYAKETKDKKELYNKVMELKGNIRVFCRCRPLNSEEIEAGNLMAIDFESAKDGDLTVKSSHGSFKKVYKFDSVFSPEDNQEMVFEKTSPLVVSVLDGYNVCIFAYGQTGTGKTFTMEGTEEARGVNYRTLEELFRVIKEREGMFKYELSVSVLEVYNEQIRDLLLPDSQVGMPAKRLEVRQVADGVHHVTGLVEANVSNMSEVWEVLQTGSKSRAVGATNVNEHSSRSHCIYCVMVKGENLVDGECTRSKLWLVDLSGSERVAKTDAQGDRLKEAQSINKSLAALGDVISALATKSPHIPYRNSKLTHLLQDSLGGDSKTLMFVQISPNENDVGETLCSLNFASRVRGIELGPAKKQVDGYKQVVEKVKQDNKNKESQIKKFEETVHSLEVKNKAKDLLNKNLQDKIKELESQLLIERKLARQHIDTKIAEKQQEEKQKIMEQDPHLQAQTLFFSPISKPSITKEQLTSCKEITNTVRPLTENNSIITNNTLAKNFTTTIKDKENTNPALPEELASTFSATRRFSLAPFSHSNKISLGTAASRRCSLIPIPDTGIFKKEIESIKESIKESKPENLNSITKRSAGKKAVGRTPLPQTVKRRTAARLENVRVSIGGAGRMPKRALVKDGIKREDKVQKLKMDKERGWNQRTVVRNVF